MHPLDVILRGAIQFAVMGVWGLFGLALVVGLTGRTIRWLWVLTHPVRAVVHLPAEDMVDAEWVRDL
jgi:hypothetical protein